MKHKLLNLLAFLCSIFIFLLLLILMFVITAKKMITRETLAGYIKDANILNMDANAIFDFGAQGTLKEKISSMALENNIPQPIVEDILDSDEINELLGDYFSEIIDYTFHDNKPVLSSDTVQKITNVSLQSLEYHINIMMSEEELKQNIIDYTNQLSNLIPNKKDMMSDSILQDIQKILNCNTITIYTVITCLILCTGILTLSFYKPLKYLGFPMLLAGILFVILSSCDVIAFQFISERITGMDAVIAPFVTNLLTLWFKCGVLVSFVGLLLLILYMMIHRMDLHTKRYG